MLQSYLFLPFTVFLAIFWIFIYKKVSDSLSFPRPGEFIKDTDHRAYLCSTHPQLPETKNRTFEEIAALFKPIHLVSSSPGFPDYGCTLAGLGTVDGDGLQQLQSATPGGSLSTPAVMGNGGNPRSSGGVDDVGKVDRFKFDLASTGKYINEQRHHHHHQHLQQHHHHQQQQQRAIINSDFDLNANDAVCCDDARTMTANCHRGSHGKLQHQMSHTSCTSLGQTNISTSDQQPLIVEGQPDCRCRSNHHHQQQSRQTQQHCPGRGQCCLRTTSFMVDSLDGANGGCTCCVLDDAAAPAVPPPLPRFRSSLRGSALSNEYPPTNHQQQRYAIADDDSDSEDADSKFHDRNQRKSKTLTRIYKPLNDLNFHNSSANNLIDNFCLPVSAGNQNTYADRL